MAEIGNGVTSASKSWDLGQLTSPTISESRSDLVVDERTSDATARQKFERENELKNKTMINLSTSELGEIHDNIEDQKRRNGNSNERCLPKVWNHFTNKIREGICLVVVSLSVHAAKHPYFYIFGTVIVSLSLVVAGAMTNISVNVDPDVLFTPWNTIATQHDQFVEDFEPNDLLEEEEQQREGDNRRLTQRDSFHPKEMDNFDNDYEDVLADHQIMMDKYNGILGDAKQQLQHNLFERNLQRQNNRTAGTTMTLLIHAHGENVANLEGMSFLFKAYETITNVAHVGSTISALNLWDTNITLFAETAHSDQDVIDKLSSATYPDGTRIDMRSIVGNAQVDSDGTVTYGESLIALVRLRMHSHNNNIWGRNFGSSSSQSYEEGDVIDSLVALRDEFAQERCGFQVEFFTARAFEDELFRGVAEDVPLLPVVIGIMILFTCFAFFRLDRVKSKSLLGLGGVITIVLSMMSGYGLMFCAGLPITPMTTMLPFVVLGIGLDDTFIISLAFNRTDENKDPVERIRDTMNEVGLSISVTTLTTTLAFILGLISSIPSIYWLCAYAMVTILIDFFYQITFFVALTVLDAHRIQANRTDCCTCFVVARSSSPPSPEAEDEDDVPSPSSSEIETPFLDRVMGMYAKQLLRPWSKVVVLVVFLGYLAACIFCTTLMEQAFRISDLTPNESFIRTFFRSMQDYTTRTNSVYIYFRNLDQSNPEVRQSMRKYLDDLVETPAFGEPPAFCWVYDFDEYLESIPGHETMTFNEQVDMMLSVPEIRRVYGRHFYRDREGNVRMSRCQIWYGKLDLYDVQNQPDTFRAERKLSVDFANEHACGVGPDEWPIFNFSEMYYLWEFYNIVVSELILTSLSAVIAVSVVTLFVVPHWTAMLYVIPTIIMLYIDLIGTLQFVGVRINAISYIALVIAIGLMVDFMLHMLMKYYESERRTREDKVIDALSTMGSSILLGGLSTFIATIPMLFASSKLFNDIFDAFFAVVVLSSCHGLIFLPVVLSLTGPEDISRNEDYLPFSGDKIDTEKSLGVKHLFPVDEEEKEEESEPALANVPLTAASIAGLKALSPAAVVAPVAPALRTPAPDTGPLSVAVPAAVGRAPKEHSQELESSEPTKELEGPKVPSDARFTAVPVSSEAPKEPDTQQAPKNPIAQKAPKEPMTQKAPSALEEKALSASSETATPFRPSPVQDGFQRDQIQQQ